MQSLRHAPHRLGSPDRPGKRTFIAVPAVVSLLLLAGDIELNPALHFIVLIYGLRSGTDLFDPYAG